MKDITNEDEIFKLACDCYDKDSEEYNKKLNCEGYEYDKQIRQSLLEDLKPWILLFAKEYRSEIIKEINASIGYDLY